MSETAEDRQEAAIRKIIIGAAVFVLAMIGLAACAFAQEHRHPPQDADIHFRFYQNWKQPDNRAVSCCSDEDCFPALAKNVNGTWYARKDETEEWVRIPASKVEYDRDTPDGRSHLCGRRYGFNNDNHFTVFCFIAGQGV